jgi:hypothetical protein
MTTLEERITMGNNVTGTGKTHGKNVAPDLVTPSPVSSSNTLLFQIFFLNQDESQSVEVLETNEIDLGEILQRLTMGETVFIKYKNQEILEHGSSVNKEEEQKLWYFTHC